MEKEKIFLIHGLYMHGAVMTFMRLKLEQRGYDVRVFSYSSVQEKLSVNAQKLAEFASKNSTDGDICHFVGHSLGGLLIRLTYNVVPEVFTGKIVTIGTPHNGSLVAKRVSEDIHQAIIGGAYENALDGELPEWLGKVPLGSLAGNKSIGIGFAHGLPKPNDGTVSVDEAHLHNQTDFIEIPLSHTALVYSSRVVKQVDYFLQNAIFMH